MIDISKAKPILFNTEMVKAILNGEKTVTRRLLKPKYRNDEFGFQVITDSTGKFVRVEKVDENECGIFADGTERTIYPAYNVGDVLYVRETWRALNDNYPVTADKDGYNVEYKAMWADNVDSGKWKPSIFMPKEAARLFLRVIDVKCERLQNITGKQTVKEGEFPIVDCGGHLDNRLMIISFSITWNSTIKKSDLDKYGWNANPWVWVYEFELIDE